MADRLDPVPPALSRWAHRVRVLPGELVLDPVEAEMAAAVVDRAFDVQMQGSRGLRALYPNGRRDGAPEDGGQDA